MMGNLSKAFQARIIAVDLTVPVLARLLLNRISDMTSARNICLAGGFARGLYMQQVLNLDPDMHDIDIFADISADEFDRVGPSLEREFGTPIRFHVGRFEKETQLRGLIEFALPKHLRKECAGVESIQFNFGASSPFANPFEYVAQANVGINQIAICKDGSVVASQSFAKDMANKTMTMNPSRDWSVNDWSRTAKKLERMIAERPEFKGWSRILVPKPNIVAMGTFWDSREPCAKDASVQFC